MIPYYVSAFVMAAFLAWLLSKYRGRFAMLDNPNERSLHSVPTPRTGGIAVLVTLVTLGAVLERLPEFSLNWWVLSGALPVVIISLLDDIRHRPPVLRLGFHLAAAAWVVAVLGGLGQLELAGRSFALGAPAAAVFTGLFVVWMINLYNFMDGMDGFAGGMTVIGFGCYSVLGHLAGDPVITAMAGMVAAAAAGFLVLNFPPARIFLGDAGAGLLGFLAAVVILDADRKQILPFFGGILIFSPFIVDATVTLLRRLWAREAVWRAHRSHYYQRLVGAGWSHRRTVLLEYLLMLATAISAILLFYNNNPGFELGLFVFWVVIYSGLGIWVGRSKSI